jgi:hypothetical protein
MTVMATVREFEEADLPQVVDLFGRVFPENGWQSASACAAYFREIFFANPWRAMAVPSWVAEAGGSIAGFGGMVGRPMLFRGEPVKVAVGCNLIVDPRQRRSPVALRLLKAMIDGPQDLTLADGATEGVRRIWQGLGAHAPLSCNLHWTRPLRPARYLVDRAANHWRWPGAAASTLAALTVPVDLPVRWLPHNRFLRSPSLCTDEPADAGSIVADFPHAARGATLHPAYGSDALQWVLRQCEDRKGYGTLRMRRVLDAARRPLGWFVYYLRRGGVCEVLQTAAVPAAYPVVLERLLADAWRHGGAAVRGRLDHAHAAELSKARCPLRWEGPATVIHSRRPEIIDAVMRGDAFLSRLDGEWWMRFVSG